ncbi:hypothetical protein CCR75_007513 [Bremia lactucae]|uniref:RWP-RK domain-containing protein n=1 Tax=Bremia lactucae TaxID=4779 RepID=A0A976IH41_BRELC|nr:hypothetical protein CCR75_007513 [Bremia lactucae]
MDRPVVPTKDNTCAPALPAVSVLPYHKSFRAASYASYVVRVHTRHGIKTLSFDILAKLFTFTAKRAAQDLGISSRTLIRVCRSLGIRRWPYLGFRSEKNVDRIRQEAIENLQRKLEKEGESLLPAVLQPDASSLRGASAKRLLQMKVETPGMRMRSYCTNPTLADVNTTIFNDNKRMQESKTTADASQHPPFAAPCSPATPLLSPPSTAFNFKLDLQRVSPNKEASINFSMKHPSLRTKTWTAPRLSTYITCIPTSSHIPSLDVLVDASILTGFKNDTLSAPTTRDQPQKFTTHPRIMSMHDILTSSH